MHILDENISEDQRKALRDHGVAIRQIGYDIGHKGLLDEQIIPFLHQRQGSTFFSHDAIFYDRRLCHARYCLVHLAVGQSEVVEFVRRFLRHPEFNSQAKRNGAAVRVAHRGLHVWRVHGPDETFVPWT